VSLNRMLMNEYEKETGKQAIYISKGVTRHFLSYVDWLEDRLLKALVAQNSTSNNTASLPCPYHSFSRHCSNVSKDVKRYCQRKPCLITQQT